MPHPKSLAKNMMLLLVAILAAGMAACSRSSGSGNPSSAVNKGSVSRPGVTVSIEPQRYLLERITGNTIDIDVIIPPGSNPETFEPSLESLALLEKEQVYFMIGTLPFEISNRERLQSNFPHLQIYTAVETLHKLPHVHYGEEPEEHEEHGHEEETDPHVWTTPENLLAMSRDMLETMKRLYPDKTSEYEANYRKLEKDLNQLNDSLVSIRRETKNNSFLIWHPTLAYFAHRYGYVQLSVEKEGKETTPEDFREAIDKARSLDTRIAIVEREHNPAMLLSLNSDLRLKTIEISVMEGDIIKNLIEIANAIRSAD